MIANQVKQAINKLKNPDKAKILSGFFKTGKGQYGEGDKFLGLTVPQQRTIAKQFTDLSLSEIKILLASPYHEHRLTGALILVEQYKASDDKLQKQIFDFYLNHSSAFNNWDLVDLTADNIVGNYLLKQNKQARKLLYNLAKSDNLWSKRIAIVSTYSFIKTGQFTDIFKLAKMLLADKHDLIHKAVGWMLREAGKQDKVALAKFLDQYFEQMPRTMLRYAIEKFPEATRQAYLKKSKIKKEI